MPRGDKSGPPPTVTAVVYHVPMRLFATILFLVLPAFAQDKQEDKAKKAPSGPPTNLKVLKVTSRQEVGQIMRTFTAGLGVQCNFCHVQGNFASDDNPKKEIGRHMIEMVEKINARFPGWQDARHLLHLPSRGNRAEDRARA